MHDVMNIVDGYLAIWNETDPARRRALIAETWSDDASYLDPMMSATGADALDGMIAVAQGQFPGFQFRPLGQPDAHNDRVRFSWALLAPGADDSVVEGTDFAVIAADGRLQSVTGFLDKVPAS
jgi:hypothetical protein